MDILQDDSKAERLFKTLQRLPFSEELQQEADRRYPHERDPLKRAKWWLISSWQNRNGFGGTDKASTGFAVRYTASGGCPAARWTRIADSIPWWVERLKNVMFKHGDSFEWLPKIEDKPTTVIYADPPYPIESRGKSLLYSHDFFDAKKEDPEEEERKQHAKLAEILNSFENARILVSTYDCPLIRELYSDWEVMELRTNKQLAQGSKRDKKGGTNAPELLLCNDLFFESDDELHKSPPEDD